MLSAIEKLAVSPFAGDVEKMRGEENIWRRRIGGGEPRPAGDLARFAHARLAGLGRATTKITFIEREPTITEAAPSVAGEKQQYTALVESELIQYSKILFVADPQNSQIISYHKNGYLLIFGKNDRSL